MEEEIHEIHEMLTELMEVLRPLKAMATSLGPVKRATLSAPARDAVKTLRSM